MKKTIIFFLSIVGILLFSFTKTNALEKDQFYIDKFTPFHYKAVKKNKFRHQGQIALIKRKSDKKEVYCIEPFTMVKENYLYKGDFINNIKKYKKEDIEKINLIAYYGYKYGNHKDIRWYVATQLLIWEVVEPDYNYILQTKKNGTVTKEQLTKEKEEIKKLVNNHYKKPKFDNDFKKLSINTKYEFKDENKVLNNYEIVSKSGEFKLNNNVLEIYSTKDQKINIELNRKIKNQKPSIIYYDSKNQDIFVFGNLNIDKLNYDLNFVKSSIKIKKTNDKEYDILYPSFKGTKFHLLDKNKEFISEHILEEGDEIFIDNLRLDEYYIKEVSSSEGYNLNEELFHINTNENSEVEIEIKNNIIKRKIKIIKYTKDDREVKKEEKVKFQIYYNDKVFKEVETDSNGEVEFYLPYGEYKVKQINGKKGYELVDDFLIIVDDEEDELIELIDLKIPDAGKSYTKVLIAIILVSLAYALEKYAKTSKQDF